MKTYRLPAFAELIPPLLTANQAECYGPSKLRPVHCHPAAIAAHAVRNYSPGEH